MAKPVNDDNKISSLTPDDKNDENTPLRGSIIKADITNEMQKSYLDYAMSVIVSRALPDVRDGLKPVQRRIIYAMQEGNMTFANKFYKCAAVVGNVLSKYHPHGDTSVYDALVRMGQDFTLRYPLIFPQGNFGSIDGDPPAAMRYTECKMQKISEELYRDIDSETVTFEINDLQNKEPLYLPSLLPNLLLNGASGIAVGMATNIPPHNLNEIVDGITHMMDNAENIGKAPSEEDVVDLENDYGNGKTDKVKVATPGFSTNANVEDLIEYIKGPDFPTGGTIYDQKEIIQMYATGKGRVVQRAKMETEEVKGKSRIIVTEIPYQINKSTLITKIAELVRDKKIPEISGLRDESSSKGMRVVIELKGDAIVKKVQNRLYKYTQLQSTFNTNMVALIDGQPKLMSLVTVLEEFIKHRQEVVIKRSIFFVKKYKAREHILIGLKKALDVIDEIIELIKKSKDSDSAKAGLMKTFDFTEIQAQAILDMQLRRLAALERQKIEDELMEITKAIDELLELIASPKKIMTVIKKELSDLKTRFGDERKTKVIKAKLGELDDEDLIPNEKCIITISASGYIKRLKEDTYKKQGRGGKGVKGQELKEEDMIDAIKTCETHDWALFFTNKGKAYKLRVWEVPESSRTAKGTHVANFLNVTNEEKVESFLVLSDEALKAGKGYLVFGTKDGTVKKTEIKQFENIRASGIIAIKLDDGDTLVWVNYSGAEEDVLLVTAKGMSIRFSSDDVRPMGRSAAGVRGIKLSKKNDFVVGMVVIPQDQHAFKLLCVSANGYGKKTSLDEYKVQNRGGSGILTYKTSDKTGDLIAARSVSVAEKRSKDILIATQSGKFIRLEENNVPELGRNTIGVRLIKLGDRDSVTSVAVLEDDALDEEIPSE